MKNSSQPTKLTFLETMLYPPAWDAWEMYPQELFDIQVADYEPGSEDAPEHFRYGAFRWWVARTISQEQLRKLLALSFLDPDQVMANAARCDLLQLVPTMPPELSELLKLDPLRGRLE